MTFLSEESHKVDKKISQIRQACADMGYPCFMRTSYYSAKFDGVCIINTDAELYQNLHQLIMSSYEEDKPVEEICIREFIQSDGTHRLLNGLPIGTERRYFIIDGVVDNGSPYWTRLAVDNNHIPDDYIEQISQISDSDSDLLRGYCNTVYNVLRYRWGMVDLDLSVDFMRDINGKWWLIDMGEAYKSWVPQ